MTRGQRISISRAPLALRFPLGKRHQEAPQEDAEAQEAKALAARASQAQALTRLFGDPLPFEMCAAGTCPNAASRLRAALGVEETSRARRTSRIRTGSALALASGSRSLSALSCERFRPATGSFGTQTVVFFGVSIDAPEKVVLASCATAAPMPRFRK